jgi:hypothetical protein
MKKTIILIAICLSLILLLGAISSRPQIYDPNSESPWYPCSISREHILEYKIVVASDPNALAGKVTPMLKGKDNWILIGGVSDNKGKYYQAMAKVTQ